MNEISKRLEQILLNMSYNPKITRQENEKIILERHKRYLINEETECERWVRLKNKPLDNNIGTIQDYLIALGFKITKDWALGNPTSTAIWTHLFGKPDTQKTSLQLWQKLKEKGYSVGNTPGCGGICQGEIAKKMYEIRNNKLKACGGIANVDYGTIKHLASLGLDGSGGNSNNQAMALAALKITKTATDRIQRQVGGKDFQKYGVCVKIVGSTCAPGTFKTYNYFDMAMAEDINSLQNQTFNGKTFKPPQYCFLQNFYFDYGKIIKPVQDATSPTAPHNNWMFPDGVWNWFTTYWETDNANEILGKIASLTTGISSQSFNASDNNDYGEPRYTMWSTEFLHDIFTVGELGALAGAFAFPPLAPILFGVSSVFGAADAGTYFAEGDTYMGSMMLGLEVIPGGELIKILKAKKIGVEALEQLGEQEVKNIIKKGMAGEITEASEAKIFNAFVKEKDKIAPAMVEAMQQQAKKNVKELGKTYGEFVKKGVDLSGKPSSSWSTFFDFIGRLSKATGSFPKMAISVGGTMWGIDQLYLALYGRDEDRQNSDIRKLYYLIKGGGLPEEEAAKKEQERLIQEFADKYLKDPEKAVATLIKQGSDTGKEQGAAAEWLLTRVRNVYNSNVKNKKPGYVGSGNENVIPTPTIQEVLNSGKKFSYGMTSDDLLKIKNKVRINFGNALNKELLMKTISNPNFDDDFLSVILDFQENVVKNFYGKEITERGPIGLETYSYIVKDPIEALPTKTTTQALDSLEEDKYEYFNWSSRKSEWVKITFGEYEKLKASGDKVEKKLIIGNITGTDSLKNLDPATLNRKERKKYYKNQEQVKQWLDFYKVQAAQQTITPEQKQALEDLSSLPLR